MKHIIFIQHCESIHHTNGMIGSWTDWELSAKGIKEANNLAHNLSKKVDLSKYTIYSSDLKRAKMTADILGSIHNKDILVRTELRERNLGTGCGKSSDWFNKNKKPDLWSVDHKCFDDAESIRDHYHRIKPFYDEILNNDEENIIVVSHGGTISTLMMLVMNLPIEKKNEVYLHGRAGSVTFINIKNNVTRINTFGDESYKKSE